MSSGKYRRREKLLRQAIESLGFQCISMVKTKRNSHYRCRVRDDKGFEFNVFTGSTCSASECSALKNFKQDVRRMSSKMRGVI